MIVAIEQRLPKDRRIIADDLTYEMLPFGMKAFAWLMRLAAGLAATFEFLARAARGSPLTFTYVHKDFIDRKAMRGQTAKAGFVG